MVGIYKIQNERTKSEVPFNENRLLRLIKALDGRNSDMYNYCVNLWENLESRRFDKKRDLEGV